MLELATFGKGGSIQMAEVSSNEMVEHLGAVKQKVALLAEMNHLGG